MKIGRAVLRVVFAGTPPFAARALEALVAAGHVVPLVLTQPDRPAGRGMRLASSAVGQCAQALGLPVLQPLTLRDPAVVARLREANPDVMVVAAYGLMLPSAVLELPTHGCLNIHASLLPRWRGAAPIQRALLAGDRTTGITLMRMEAGLDTGPILVASEIPISDRDTTGTLTESLAELGAHMIASELEVRVELPHQLQDERFATYAPKVAKSEARINWRNPAVGIDRQVRAFNPSPGAQAGLQGDTVKVWSASPCDAQGMPGEVLRAKDNDLIVACGENALRIHELQRSGGKRMATSEFLRGAVLDSAVFD